MSLLCTIHMFLFFAQMIFRYNLPCGCVAMLQQPRVPPTGQRQAIEIQIKWQEVLTQKQDMLKILSKTTGHSIAKLDKVSSHATKYYLEGMTGETLRQIDFLHSEYH